MIALKASANQGSTIKSGDILWTWHLWFTNYHPDEFASSNIVSGTYSYAVTGGSVHRYNNTIFNTGIYKDKVIMDRNLGAYSTGYNGDDDLYYQFGRKDPLPAGRTIYGGSYAKADYQTDGVTYSIRNPLAFIKGSSGPWTGGANFNSTSILWQDPNVKADSHGKSIFDPCPPGWKVPENGTWTDVSSSWGNTGRTFSSVAFYPASGGLYAESGSIAIAWVSDGGHSWSCSPYSTTIGYLLAFNSHDAYPSFNYLRAYGFPVRCVRE